MTIMPTEIVSNLVGKSVDSFSDFDFISRKIEQKNGESVKQKCEA